MPLSMAAITMPPSFVREQERPDREHAEHEQDERDAGGHRRGDLEQLHGRRRRHQAGCPPPGVASPEEGGVDQDLRILHAPVLDTLTPSDSALDSIAAPEPGSIGSIRSTEAQPRACSQSGSASSATVHGSHEVRWA
jgi:hypothetical protein